MRELIDQKKITAHKRSEIGRFAPRDDGSSSRVVLQGKETRIPSDFVLALIGGVPNTERLRPLSTPDKHAARVARDGNGFVLTEQVPWPYPREYKPNGEEGPGPEKQKPKVLALQTGEEGLSAAVDVRAGSVRRTAQAAGGGNASTVSTDAHLRRGDSAGLALGDTVSGAYKYYLHGGK
ncbi:hypothetical protein [Nocardiopsis halotolerans]|uniref:hypothetical protein n=1 Tax=Nocardiopsis halotolerans TaxID=124252 RepID=UPI00036F1B76|nr:hypothetical protein [Nocardiopsis halotolerans]